MILARRSLITGLSAFLAAPAIVRASSLMPVRVVRYPIIGEWEWPGASFLLNEGYSLIAWDGDPQAFRVPDGRMLVWDYVIHHRDGTSISLLPP